MDQERPGPDVDVSNRGELDFLEHYKNCTKNPNHKNFKLLHQFNKDDLPDGCQDSNLLDLIDAASGVTVCLSVSFVSMRRPETFPGTDEAYPFFRNRGRNMMIKGTGWVNRVDILNEPANSQAPKVAKALIHIHTAAHVVYDEIEGAHTTCYLFFNRGGTPDKCNDVVTLSGMISVESDVTNDRCHMSHETNDIELAKRMALLVKNWKCLRQNAEERCCRHITEMAELNTEPPLEISQGTLTIIVSHIHGCSKRVSVGNCINLHEQGDWIQYKYTTATCRGSSGALVFVVGRKHYDSSNWYFGLVHSRGRTAYNVSGHALVKNGQGEDITKIEQFKQDLESNRQCWCVHVNNQIDNL